MMLPAKIELSSLPPMVKAVLPAPVLVVCGPANWPEPLMEPSKMVLPALRGCRVPLMTHFGLSEPMVLLVAANRMVAPGAMLMAPEKPLNWLVSLPVKLMLESRWSVLRASPEVNAPEKLLPMPTLVMTPVSPAGTNIGLAGLMVLLAESPRIVPLLKVSLPAPTLAPDPRTNDPEFKAMTPLKLELVVFTQSEPAPFLVSEPVPLKDP